MRIELFVTHLGAELTLMGVHSLDDQNVYEEVVFYGRPALGDFR